MVAPPNSIYFVYSSLACIYRKCNFGKTGPLNLHILCVSKGVLFSSWQWKDRIHFIKRNSVVKQNKRCENKKKHFKSNVVSIHCHLIFFVHMYQHRDDEEICNKILLPQKYGIKNQTMRRLFCNHQNMKVCFFFEFQKNMVVEIVNKKDGQCFQCLVAASPISKKRMSGECTVWPYQAFCR